MYRCYTTCSCVPYINIWIFPYTDRQTTKLSTVFERVCVTKTKKNRIGNRLQGNRWRREYYLFINTFFRWKREQESCTLHTKPNEQNLTGKYLPVLIANINKRKLRNLRRIEFQEKESEHKSLIAQNQRESMRQLSTNFTLFRTIYWLHSPAELLSLN